MAASTTLTPEQRTLRAQIAAHYSWAKTADRGAKGRKSVEARLEKFEREIDPDGVLPTHERRQRAESALQAHMKSLALRSAQARRKK